MTKPPSSKSKKRQSKEKNVASSNWFDLQKKLDSNTISKPVPHRKKRQKLDSDKPEDLPSLLSPYHKPVLSMSLPPVSEHVGSSSSLGDGDVDVKSATSLQSVALARERQSINGKSPKLAPRLYSSKSKGISLSMLRYHEPVHSTSPSRPFMSVLKDMESSSSRGSGDADENSRTSLRSMALATEDKFSDEQRLPGRYLSLDCEMVGVGINASESSLARVSLVNYYGAVIMDEYVKQRERVVDYRTRWSGIRASDMINAKPFEEVQKKVNDLLDGRILIGHAVYNDLKVLLLSHPHRQTRDTQVYAYKFALSKSRTISLKNLAKRELDIDIQTGEHSSVIDARATMAIYRLHKKDWERASGSISEILGYKRKRSTQDAGSSLLAAMLERDGIAEAPPTSNIHKKTRGNTKDTSSFPGGGRKGVSSGLSTVVRSGEGLRRSKHAWWKSLPAGAKGYVRVDR